MKQLPRLITAVVIISLLSGCGMSQGIYSNFRSNKELRLIQTLGYDTENGAVTLSASTGTQAESKDPLLLRRSSDSILRAMDSLQNYTTEGELYFAHTRFVVAGRAAADRGLGELLDLMERNGDLRLSAELFLLENGSAGDLVMGPGGDSYDITEVLNSVKRDVALRGVSRVTNFRETAVALSEYGAALVCLLRAVGTEGSVDLEEPGLSAVPVGYGILKDGRLVGVIEDEAAEAASLLLGYSGTVTRTFPDGQGGTVTLQFEGDGGGLTPSWNDDGTPAPVEAALRVRAVVAETDTDRTSIMLDPAYQDYLCGELERSLAENLRAVLDKAQALDADFLALGGKLRRSGAGRFAALPEDWLTRLEFNVSVEASIDRSYDLDDPVGTDGGEQKKFL